MKKLTKPEDVQAAELEWGIELETFVPQNCGVAIGDYHHGHPVTSGVDANSQMVQAPVFNRTHWRAERDGSIRADSGYLPCEFVSPVLRGEEGVAKLREFIRFLHKVGAKVNDSCGCHVTVGLKALLGSTDPATVAHFVRKLAVIANHNAWALYGQTGSGRHVNNVYAQRLSGEVEQLTREMERTTDTFRLTNLANQCGRGMVNFRKAFLGERAAIEFRVFAGTTNEAKIMHHVATALGLMRRAHLTQVFGAFKKSAKKHKAATAVEALRRMWRVLGWVDSVPGRDVALGLFGALHVEFGSYRNTALEMSKKFEERFPAANL